MDASKSPRRQPAGNLKLKMMIKQRQTAPRYTRARANGPLIWLALDLNDTAVLRNSTRQVYELHIRRERLNLLDWTRSRLHLAEELCQAAQPRRLQIASVRRCD